MKIINIVGARPNFMKVAPVHQAMLDAGHEALLIHTGQHYDENMSKVFFEQLGMPKPDLNLEVGSGSHAVQTAKVMTLFEPVVLEHKPDWVMVAGDVNSTVACALVAAKLHIKVAHLEAGLRSFDRQMPEELNRLVTDQLSDCLLTPSADADAHLRKEGIPKERIHRVGNAMIDSLRKHLEKAKTSDVLTRLGVEANNYCVLTMHRPSNVDVGSTLEPIVEVLLDLSDKLPLLFALHPRTRQKLEHFGLLHRVEHAPGIRVLPPLGYLDFLAMQAQAKMVLTDSGGIQEETTALGVPCLTIRENTERPVTITEGTNTLVGTNPHQIRRVALEVIAGRGKAGRVPDLWDGKTGPRVVRAMESMS